MNAIHSLSPPQTFIYSAKVNLNPVVQNQFGSSWRAKRFAKEEKRKKSGRRERREGKERGSDGARKEQMEGEEKGEKMKSSE